MTRRLFMIEREMGYCAINLEKNRRLRKQIQYLEMSRASQDRLVRESTRGIKVLKLKSASGTDPGRTPRLSREEFLANGLEATSRETLEFLHRELDHHVDRLKQLSVFEDKLLDLEKEKKSAARRVHSDDLKQMDRFRKDFKKTEHEWSILSEDLLGLEEGILFLKRNLEYLETCRNFLVTARSTFDVESWVTRGYLSDLFQHSPIGRAREMAEGADRNVMMAQKALIGVTTVKLIPGRLQWVLEDFLEALHQDIYEVGRICHASAVIDRAMAENTRVSKQARSREEHVKNKLERTEKAREKKFSRWYAARHHHVGELQYSMDRE